jgi:uncharacterized protein
MLARWAAGIGVAGVLAIGAYTGYVGAVGSSLLMYPEPRAECGTPGSEYGWPYEAINYPIEDDDRLERDARGKCPHQGVTAGNEVVTEDGVPIAGWYIPAASGIGPEGPTVILVHGWNANKSDVLRYAVPLRPQYNVVALDLRFGGRSGGDAVTLGMRERLDVRAIVDWLERTKGPRAIALLGNSMGGATALAAAADDPRIGAVVIDSTHADGVHLLARRLEVEEGQPPYPGTWGILLGIVSRAGLDAPAVDPVDTVTRLGSRPLLVLHGTADRINLPGESAEVVARAARDAGVSVELRHCQGGRHGRLIDDCPDDWAAWTLDFLDRALGGDTTGQPRG